MQIPAILVILSLALQLSAAAPTATTTAPASSNPDAPQPEATHGAVPFNAEDFARGLKPNDWIKVEIVTEERLSKQLNATSPVSAEKPAVRPNDQLALETSKDEASLVAVIKEVEAVAATTLKTMAEADSLIVAAVSSTAAPIKETTAEAQFEKSKTEPAIKMTTTEAAVKDTTFETLAEKSPSITETEGPKHASTTSAPIVEATVPSNSRLADLEEYQTETTTMPAKISEEIEVTTSVMTIEAGKEEAKDDNIFSLVQEMLQGLLKEVDEEEEADEAATAESSTDRPVSEKTIVKEYFYKTGHKNHEAVATTQASEANSTPTTIKPTAAEAAADSEMTTPMPELKDTKSTKAVNKSSEIEASTLLNLESTTDKHAEQAQQNVSGGTTNIVLLDVTEEPAATTQQAEHVEEEPAATMLEAKRLEEPAAMTHQTDRVEEPAATMQQADHVEEPAATTLQTEHIEEAKTELATPADLSSTTEFDPIANIKRTRAPRVERYQAKDGIEILYGYSSVKSNK